MDNQTLSMLKDTLVGDLENLIDNTVKLKEAKEQVKKWDNALFIGPEFPNNSIISTNDLLDMASASDLKSRYLLLTDQWIEAQESKIIRIREILGEGIEIEYPSEES